MILIIAVLAIFFVWETVLSVVPWNVPPWLQPVLVYGAALAFCWPDWRLAMAVSGGVALLHVFLTRERPNVVRPKPVTELQRPTRTPRVPDLP